LTPTSLPTSEAPPPNLLLSRLLHVAVPFPSNLADDQRTPARFRQSGGGALLLGSLSFRLSAWRRWNPPWRLRAPGIPRPPLRTESVTDNLYQMLPGPGALRPPTHVPVESAPTRGPCERFVSTTAAAARRNRSSKWREASAHAPGRGRRPAPRTRALAHRFFVLAKVSRQRISTRLSLLMRTLRTVLLPASSCLFPCLLASESVPSASFTPARDHHAASLALASERTQSAGQWTRPRRSPRCARRFAS